MKAAKMWGPNTDDLIAALLYFTYAKYMARSRELKCGIDTSVAECFTKVVEGAW